MVSIDYLGGCNESGIEIKCLIDSSKEYSIHYLSMYFGLLVESRKGVMRTESNVVINNYPAYFHALKEHRNVTKGCF